MRNKWLILTAFIFIPVAVWLIQKNYTKPLPVNIPEPVLFEDIQEEDKKEESADIPTNTNTENPSVIDTEDPLPLQFNLAVPFTSQAPHTNWELPYQEACEEASLMMVHSFYEGNTIKQIDPSQADTIILQMVEKQETLFGFYESTTVQQTAHLASELYGYKASFIENPTKDDLKKWLISGYPIIVPAAGRLLGNPHFQSPGPIYHMLVIKGYTEEGFITNDPGTQHGHNYIYSFDVLLNAIHDYADPIETGKKVVFILTPS